jgi:hypothetical protein
MMAVASVLVWLAFQAAPSQAAPSGATPAGAPVPPATATPVPNLTVTDARATVGPASGGWLPEDIARHVRRNPPLGALPADPTNRWADSADAAALGHRLFFDERLSASGTVSCATCHDPAQGFSDGRPLAKGEGTGTRHSMTVLNAAHQRWFTWDGRADTLWSQAVQPFETPHEMNMPRARVVQRISEDSVLRAAYRRAFGAEPPAADAPPAMVDAAFAKVGKAIAAYEHFLREGSPGVERSAVESRIAALRARPATPPPVVAAPPPPVVIAPPPAVVRPAVAPVTHHPSRALPIGLLVGGGVALAGALTLGATVMSTDGDLAARCPGGQCATSPDDEVASGRARALAADVIGLVGVGALAAGVVVWIAQGARPAPSSAGATVSAGCGPGSCGAFVRGAF